MKFLVSFILLLFLVSDTEGILVYPACPLQVIQLGLAQRAALAPALFQITIKGGHQHAGGPVIDIPLANQQRGTAGIMEGASDNVAETGYCAAKNPVSYKLLIMS